MGLESSLKTKFSLYAPGKTLSASRTLIACAVASLILTCQPADAREDQLLASELVWNQRYTFIKLAPAAANGLRLRLGLSANEFREIDTRPDYSIYRLPVRMARATTHLRYFGKIPFRFVVPDIIERRSSDDPARLYNGYKDDVVAGRILKFLEARYPDYAKVYTIGRSTRGRPILALKISDNVSKDENEPAFLFNAAHHGNEPLTPDFPIDLATVLLSSLDIPEDRLLPRIDVDFKQPFFRELLGGLKPAYRPERLRAYIDDYEIWIVPVVNPDGLRAFWNQDAGMGRKNGRDTAPPVGLDRRDGVDLNRNYPFYWKSGNPSASSDRPDNYYYRGPSAASEPETRAMMALANRERFVMALSFHSWATRVLVPYTIDEVMNPFPHVAWILGEKLAAAGISFLPGRAYEAAKNLYAVDGTDEDWLHFQHGTMAYIIESSFHTPAYDRHGRDCVTGMRPLSLRALELYREGPLLAVEVRSAGRRGPGNSAGAPLAGIPVRVKDFAYFEGEKFTTNRHGRIDFFLPGPGEFILEVGPPDKSQKRLKVRCEDGVCKVPITLTVE